MSSAGSRTMLVRYNPGSHRSSSSGSSYRAGAGGRLMLLPDDTWSQSGDFVSTEILIIFWHWKRSFEVQQPLSSLGVSAVYRVSTDLRKIKNTRNFEEVMKEYVGLERTFFVGSVFESLFKDALNKLKTTHKLTWTIEGNLTLPGEIQKEFSRSGRFWNWFWQMTSNLRRDYNPFFVLPPVYYRRPINVLGTRGVDAPRTKYYVLPIYRQRAWLKSPTELFRCRDRRRWRLVYKDLDLKKNPRVLLHRYRVRLSAVQSYGIYVVQSNPLYDENSKKTKYKPPGRGSVSVVMRGRSAFRGIEDGREDVDEWCTKGFENISRQNTTKKLLTVLPQISSERENSGMAALYAFCHDVGLSAVHDDFDYTVD